MYEYRFRWDSAVYEPGELRVVTYKNGKIWATNTVKTAGNAAKLQLTTDRNSLRADGTDLVFVTLQVTDEKGNLVPEAADSITFEVAGPGEIIATDNGDPSDFTPFPSAVRKAYSGMALAIVRTRKGTAGSIVITAKSSGLTSGRIY